MCKSSCIMEPRERERDGALTPPGSSVTSRKHSDTLTVCYVCNGVVFSWDFGRYSTPLRANKQGNKLWLHTAIVILLTMTGQAVVGVVSAKTIFTEVTLSTPGCVPTYPPTVPLAPFLYASMLKALMYTHWETSCSYTSCCCAQMAP